MSEKDVERERVRQETEKIMRELKSKNKKQKNKEKKKDDKAGKEAKEMLRKQREKYATRKKKTQEDVENAYDSFRSKIFSENGSESWVNHKLQFEQDDSETKVKDPSLDDSLMVLNAGEWVPGPGERLMNKHQQKLKAKKNLEKW